MTDTYEHGVAGMLAAIFKSIRQQINDSWREPLARTFDEVAQALESGMDPKEVAMICRAAAKGVRDPAKSSEAIDSCEQQIQSRRR